MGDRTSRTTGTGPIRGLSGCPGFVGIWRMEKSVSVQTVDIGYRSYKKGVGMESNGGGGRSVLEIPRIGCPCRLFPPRSHALPRAETLALAVPGFFLSRTQTHIHTNTPAHLVLTTCTMSLGNKSLPPPVIHSMGFVLAATAVVIVVTDDDDIESFDKNASSASIPPSR